MRSHPSPRFLLAPCPDVDFSAVFRPWTAPGPPCTPLSPPLTENNPQNRDVTKSPEKEGHTFTGGNGAHAFPSSHECPGSRGLLGTSLFWGGRGGWRGKRCWWGSTGTRTQRMN